MESWIRTSYIWVAASCTPHTSTTFASDKLLVPNTVTLPGTKLDSTHRRLLNLHHLDGKRILHFFFFESDSHSTHSIEDGHQSCCRQVEMVLLTL